jgi:hypothetical protein
VVKPLGSFEWGVVLTGGAVVVVLAGSYALDRGGNVAARVAAPVRVEVKAAPVAVLRQAPAATEKPPGLSTFRFTAARGGSWLQARAGSSAGPVVFQGELSEGETVRLRSRRLWVRFGAASHLDLFVDGRRAWLPSFGTYDAFVTRRGVRADRTDYATAAQSP